MTLYKFLLTVLTFMLATYLIRFVLRIVRTEFKVMTADDKGKFHSAHRVLIEFMLKTKGGQWLYHCLPAFVILLMAACHSVLSLREAVVLFLLSYVTFAVRDYDITYGIIIYRLKQKIETGEITPVQENTDK